MRSWLKNDDSWDEDDYTSSCMADEQEASDVGYYAVLDCLQDDLDLWQDEQAALDLSQFLSEHGPKQYRWE